MVFGCRRPLTGSWRGTRRGGGELEPAGRVRVAAECRARSQRLDPVPPPLWLRRPDGGTASESPPGGASLRGGGGQSERHPEPGPPLRVSVKHRFLPPRLAPPPPASVLGSEPVPCERIPQRISAPVGQGPHTTDSPKFRFGQGGVYFLILASNSYEPEAAPNHDKNTQDTSR